MFEKKDATVNTVETEVETLKKSKKEKKEKKAKKAKKGGLSIAAFIVPFIFSIMLIVGLYVLIGNTTESAVTTIQVMHAATDIEANAYIPAEEYSKYFKVCNDDVNNIPKTAITDASVLPEKGVYVERAVAANQMVLVSDLAENDPVMDKYFNEVYKTSIATSSFKSSVSGRVRRGDIIDVYAKNDDDELKLFAHNVYVENAYDANGKICKEDGDIAVSFNVWVSAEEIEGLNYAITLGDIQIYLTEN